MVLYCIGFFIMETFYFSILTGIISGLLTAFLTVVFYKFYLGIVQPWYIDLIYKGVRLDGEWRGGTHAEVSEIKTLLNLKQKGSALRGSLSAETIYPANPSDNYSNNYNIEGYVRNNIVVLNYEAVSQQRTGIGVFVFKVANGGKKMKGMTIHSEDVSNMWHRDNFVLERSY